jgi:hypothetical protein
MAAVAVARAARPFRIIIGFPPIGDLDGSPFSRKRPDESEAFRKR